VLRTHSLLANKHLVEKNRNKINKRNIPKVKDAMRLEPGPLPLLHSLVSDVGGATFVRYIGVGEGGDAAAILNAKKKKPINAIS
jgi:hypothetical protein